MNGQPEAEDEDRAGPDQASAGGTETAAGDDGGDTGGEMAALRAKAEENWDRYLRAAAETENVRKRAARDVQQARKYALEQFAGEILGVRDSLEMGLAAAESADIETLLAGSETTLKQLAGVLERFGIEEVDPLGEPFDPEYHEAMTVQPSAEAEPGSVLTVIQKGYTLNGRLLRPARVIVAAEAADGTGGD